MNEKEKLPELLDNIGDDVITESAAIRGSKKPRKESTVLAAFKTVGCICAAAVLLGAIVVMPSLLKDPNGPSYHPNDTKETEGYSPTTGTPIYSETELITDEGEILINNKIPFSYYCDSTVFEYPSEYYDSHKIFLIQSRQELLEFIDELYGLYDYNSPTVDTVNPFGAVATEYINKYTDEYFESNDIIILPFEEKTGRYFINHIDLIVTEEKARLNIEFSGASSSYSLFRAELTVEIGEKLPEGVDVQIKFDGMDADYKAEAFGESIYDSVVLSSRKQVDEYINKLINEDIISDSIVPWNIDSIKEKLSKYDGEYFLTKSVVIISGWLESGSYDIEVDSVTWGLDGVKVNLNKIIPDCGTDDIKPWDFIIELDGKVPYDSQLTVKGASVYGDVDKGVLPSDIESRYDELMENSESYDEKELMTKLGNLFKSIARERPKYSSEYAALVRRMTNGEFTFEDEDVFDFTSKLSYVYENFANGTIELGVQKLTASSGKDSYTINIEHIGCGKYKVEMANDEVIYYGERAEIYDGSLGKNLVKITLQDSEYSKAFEMKFKPYEVYELINSMEIKNGGLKLMTCISADHAVLIYLGTDADIKVDEQGVMFTNEPCGTISVELEKVS